MSEQPEYHPGMWKEDICSFVWRKMKGLWTQRSVTEVTISSILRLNADSFVGDTFGTLAGRRRSSHRHMRAV